MKDLQKTTPGGNGVKPHTHIIFTNPERQAGESSTDANHSHQVSWIPPVDPQYQVDPQSGQQTEVAPGQPGYFKLEAAMDGHTHEILPDELPRTGRVEAELSDDEIVQEVYTYYESAVNINSDSITAADEADGFYTGEKQWTQQEKDYLKDRDRACLTINKTKKEVNKLSGNQRQSRTDIKLVPVGGTDQKVCDLANIAIKNILEQCMFPREESKVFTDAIIRGCGWFNIYIDKMRNPEGDIIVERFNARDVKAGEHEKEDLEDCEYLVKDKMYSMGHLRTSYADQFDDLQMAFDQFQNMIPAIVNEDKSKDAYLQGNTTETNMFVAGQPMVDVQKKEMRVVELWKTKYITVPVISNPDQDFYYDGYGLTKADLKSIKTIPGFYRVDRTVKKMVIYRVCAGRVLEASNPAKLPSDDFYMVPVYCLKRGNRYYGKVEDIKDVQREINKRHSQLVDIGNKAAGSGWFHTAESFADPKDKVNFKNNVASQGFVVEVSDMQQKPERVEGGDIPPVAVQLLETGDKDLVDLMNVTVDANGANESNAMFTYRQKLAFVGNEELFENLKFSKIKLGRLLVANIQDLYTAERLWNLVMDEDTKAKAEGKPAMQLGGESLENFTIDDIERLLKENDLTKTQVIVSEGVFSPSVRMSIFATLSDLKQAGADVPLELLFEFADLPKEVKDKISSQLQQQAATEAQAQQEKSTTELLKTAMGKGIMTPQIQQKLQEALGIPANPGAAEGQQGDLVQQ